MKLVEKRPCYRLPNARIAAFAGTALLLFASAGSSSAETAIEPEADAILHAMSDQLAGLKSFSVDYDADQEVVDSHGQKLQYSASGSLSLARDVGFLITRQGPFADVEVRFDGKVISLYGKGMNVFAQMDSPGPSLDEAINEIRLSTGLDVAGADLLIADPYSALVENVVSGAVVGDAFVGGVECDHLAFRNDAVDWQIWISKGEPKLPVKYVITTKWVTGAPQYALRLSNWKAGDVDATGFTFTPPADAKKLEEINVDQIGDLTLETSE